MQWSDFSYRSGKPQWYTQDFSRRGLVPEGRSEAQRAKIGDLKD